jgi:hypothetical protein
VAAALEWSGQPPHHQPRNGKLQRQGAGAHWHRQHSDPVPVSVPEHKEALMGDGFSSRHHTTLQVTMLTGSGCT